MKTAQVSTPDFLAVGTTKFARNGSLLSDSVFHPEGSASGLFRVTGKGVLFMLPDGSPFAFLVANKHGERFFVSCSRQDDGRIRYMFSLCSSDGARLGLAAMGYGDQQREAQRVLESIEV